MEKILNFFGLGRNKIEKFPKKPKKNFNFPKSNLVIKINKYPVHVIKNIFEFLQLETEQIEHSKICRKFKRAFDLCCKEAEILNIKSSLGDNFTYFIFSKIANFKELRKLYIYNIRLDRTLLDNFYKSNFEKLTKLKIIDTIIIDIPYQEQEEELNKFSSFISRFKNYKNIFFSNFYGYFQKDKKQELFTPINFGMCFQDGLENLQKLTITKCKLQVIDLNKDFVGKIDLFKRFPNLEFLDLTDNNLNFNFIVHPKYITFGKSEKIKKIILRHNTIKLDYRNINEIKSEFLSNQVFPNYELLDVSNNYLRSMLDNNEDFKKNFPKLIIKKENLINVRATLMRMLFSRSAILEKDYKEHKHNTIYNNENHRNIKDDNERYGKDYLLKNKIIDKNLSIQNYSKEEVKESQVLDEIEKVEKYQFSNQEKFLAKKSNGAVLPCIVYQTIPNISFDKSTLLKILQTENELRLSDFAKTVYDKNYLKGKDFHLNLDLSLIKQALLKNGFNPDIDESLKAYHLATKKFISDPEVNDSVVWMKYDKCKVGKYSIGDTPDYKNIKVFDFNKNEFSLKNLVSHNKKTLNLIVSGSLS